jgi:hypothetical protein
MAPVSNRHSSQSTSRYTSGRDYRSRLRFDDRSRRDNHYDVKTIQLNK